MFEKSLMFIKKGIGTAFPCAAVAVGKGSEIYVRDFFGMRQLHPIKEEISEDTLFDLASLSKIVSTTMVALKFIENKKISVYDDIGKFLQYTGNYGNCSIFHLMTHTSGLPAFLPLYTEKHDNCGVLGTILDSDRRFMPGEEVLYSCMGYIVLKEILEIVGNDSLDHLAEKYVFDPLLMLNTCYNPDLKKCFAATEKYPHNGEWATGHVHDENAYFFGGISGNAGVFSTLDDMISFAVMCSLKGGTKNGERYLTEEIFDLSIKNYTSEKKESRGLGFQLKGNQAFPCGELFSYGSYGHTGFTGTSLYVDKETGLWSLLLTNAVHYGRDNKNEYFSVRKKFYDSLIEESKLYKGR